MSWKQIPNEEPAKVIFKKTHISPRFIKRSLYQKTQEPNPVFHYRLFQSVSMRLLEYTRRGGKYSLREVADLINDMQKTIVNLQKKRVNLCDKQKNKLNPLFKFKKHKHGKND